MLVEDALKHLHEAAYRNQEASAESVAGVLGISLDEAGHVVDLLERSDLAVRSGQRLTLTGQGQDYAGTIVRAHRLYETYLARVSGSPADLWHTQADRQEHHLSREDVEELASQLGDPRFDPHGDPIPTREGDMPDLRGISLLKAEPGWQGKVLHLEDEPGDVYQQLVALNLAPGVVIEVTQADTHGIALRADGTDMRLTRAMAANLRVEPLPPSEEVDTRVRRLSSLEDGEEATIVGLAPACVGPERNRLLDLGVLPGTEVSVALRSPHRSPIAYRIRGATIALRREQADRILIRQP
jgi:DtxR family Mn-dependent transcriptional regulator